MQNPCHQTACHVSFLHANRFDSHLGSCFANRLIFSTWHPQWSLAKWARTNQKNTIPHFCWFLTLEHYIYVYSTSRLRDHAMGARNKGSWQLSLHIHPHAQTRQRIQMLLSVNIEYVVIKDSKGHNWCILESGNFVMFDHPFAVWNILSTNHWRHLPSNFAL